MDSYPSLLSSCQTYDCRKGAIITLSHSHVTPFMISAHVQVRMGGLEASKDNNLSRDLRIAQQLPELLISW